jgi:hypothetical protein
VTLFFALALGVLSSESVFGTTNKVCYFAAWT